jgi:uncharacterized protein
MDSSTQQKFDRLHHELGKLLQDGLVIAFSGGVDSAFLLWTAEHVRRHGGGRLLALTAVSASMAQVERDDAARFARQLGVDHRWEQSQEVSDQRYAANNGDRCYYCKTELFRICHSVANKSGYKWLAYGYNHSDRADVRHGHRAALENNVLAPLAAAELSKDDIRTLMRANGLELSEKPASPCLSSRLMTGVPVTPAKLADVEAMEKILRDGGLRVFRARIHEGQAAKFIRIETVPEEMSLALQYREVLQREGSARGYRWVLLDLGGYRLGGGV